MPSPSWKQPVGVPTTNHSHAATNHSSLGFDQLLSCLATHHKRLLDDIWRLSQENQRLSIAHASNASSSLLRDSKTSAYSRRESKRSDKMSTNSQSSSLLDLEGDDMLMGGNDAELLSSVEEREPCHEPVCVRTSLPPELKKAQAAKGDDGICSELCLSVSESPQVRKHQSNGLSSSRTDRSSPPASPGILTSSKNVWRQRSSLKPVSSIRSRKASRIMDNSTDFSCDFQLFSDRVSATANLVHFDTKPVAKYSSEGSSVSISRDSVNVTKSRHPSMHLDAWVSSQSIDRVTEGLDNAALYHGENGVYPSWFKPKGKQFNLTTVEQMLSMRSLGMPSHCVLKSLGVPRLTWDFLWSIVVAYDMWVIPMDWIFLESVALPDALKTVAWFTTGFFTIDILLNFVTAYREGNHEVVQHSKIAKNYLQSWFFLDVLVTVPWSEVFGSDTDASSTIRASKYSKVLKLVKMAKLVRVFRVFRNLRVAKEVASRKTTELMKKANSQRFEDRGSSVFSVQKMVPLFTEVVFPSICLPVLLLVALVPLSHTLAFGYGFSHEEARAATDFHGAVENYFRCFWWAFSVMSFGSTISLHSSFGTNTFYLLVLWFRLILVLTSLRVLFRKTLTYIQDAGDSVRNADAITYLEDHGVSVNTKVQVLHNVRENASIRKIQNNFHALMDSHIPTELARTIREELWCWHLSSLGLISETCEWNEDFLPDLAQLVQEEPYASKVIVFREGDAAIIAYMVLKGKVVVIDSSQDDKDIPPFTQGMWLGEKALVNPELRRSGTALTMSVSSLMMVPASGFAALLDKHDLRRDFQYLCVNELWKGLCGRCGALGAHWSHECPYLHSKPKHSFFDRQSRRNSRVSSNSPSAQELIARDLELFTQQHKLKHAIPFLQELKITCLDDIVEALKTETFGFLDDAAFSADDRRALSIESVKKFKAQIKRATKEVLVGRGGNVHTHYVFLSHYKMEAGTEAALMRSELEQLISETSDHPAQRLKSPVFLDSEDLSHLQDLMEAVRRSHNIILMLTKGMLSRPWCLVEIVTAAQEGIPMIPVSITKAGCEFTFPDARFYDQMMDGTILGAEGMALLEDNGISMSDVVCAVQTALQRIAIPYSPHRPVAIRRAELNAILKLSSMRDHVTPGRMSEARQVNSAGHLRQSQTLFS